MFILTAGAGALASTVVGGLLGGESSGGGTSQATQSRNPWEPAQPYLLQDLKTNQDLQSYYTKNPFNAQQKVGLQNTMGNADHFRSSIMPGLMDFANRGMTGSYQRQTGGAPGSGGGYGGPIRPAGLLQSGQGAFSAPQGGLFGQVDWNAVNPFTNGHMEAIATQREAEAEIERQRLAALQALQAQQKPYDYYYNDGGTGNDGGYGGSSSSDSSSDNGAPGGESA